MFCFHSHSLIQTALCFIFPQYYFLDRPDDAIGYYQRAQDLASRDWCSGGGGGGGGGGDGVFEGENAWGGGEGFDDELMNGVDLPAAVHSSRQPAHRRNPRMQRSRPSSRRVVVDWCAEPDVECQVQGGRGGEWYGRAAAAGGEAHAGHSNNQKGRPKGREGEGQDDQNDTEDQEDRGERSNNRRGVMQQYREKFSFVATVGTDAALKDENDGGDDNGGGRIGQGNSGELTERHRWFTIAGKSGVLFDGERVFTTSHGALAPLHYDHGCRNRPHHHHQPRSREAGGESSAQPAQIVLRLPRVASVLQHRGTQYYHLLLEVLPRLMMLLDHSVGGATGKGRRVPLRDERDITILVPSLDHWGERGQGGSDQGSGGGSGDGSGGGGGDGGRARGIGSGWLELVGLLPYKYRTALLATPGRLVAYRPREMTVAARVVYFADWRPPVDPVEGGDNGEGDKGNEWHGEGGSGGLAVRRARPPTYYFASRHALRALSHGLRLPSSAPPPPSSQSSPSSRLGSAEQVAVGHVLYVSRSDSRRLERRVRNEAGLVDSLRHVGASRGWGVSVVLAGRMRLVDLALAFRAAHGVVGPHGAGLAHIIFCDPTRAALLEIAVPESHAGHYGHTAAALGMRYARVAAVNGSNYASVLLDVPEGAMVEAARRLFV